MNDPTMAGESDRLPKQPDQNTDDGCCEPNEETHKQYAGRESSTDAARRGWERRNFASRTEPPSEREGKHSGSTARPGGPIDDDDHRGYPAHGRPDDDDDQRYRSGDLPQNKADPKGKSDPSEGSGDSSKTGAPDGAGNTPGAAPRGRSDSGAHHG
jgi:hypothetical protein